MNPNHNHLLPLISVFLLMAVGIPATGHAQDWQAPALQQPVRQYYSGARYPLTETNDAITPVQPTRRPATLPKAGGKHVDEINLKDVPPTPSVVDKSPALTAKPKTESKYRSRATQPAVDKQTASVLKKSDNKKDAKADKKDGKSQPKVAVHHPVKTWDIYRDRSRYPIDPRKPCSLCKRELGSCQCGCQFSHRRIGNQGMPWQDTEPGGRACGKKNCSDKRPEYSVYWPKPLSARRENRDGCCVGCGHAICRCRRVNDLFDHLVNFQLIDYQRKDNGHCGPGADPYGCLGESRSQVAGVGFRFPSEPVTR